MIITKYTLHCNEKNCKSTVKSWSLIDLLTLAKDQGWFFKEISINNFEHYCPKHKEVN